jgi:hypothetical protein
VLVRHPNSGGTHHPNNLAQQFLLTSQAACDLGHEVFRQPEVGERLLEGFGDLLRLAAITCQALLRCAVATLSRFYLFFRVSLRGRNGVLLRVV